MIKQLRDIITDIRYGPHFRTTQNGEVKYLKGNHFDEDVQLSLFGESYVNDNEDVSKYLLQENDVLIAAKGFRNFAWRYTADHGPCVASSLFYVIKLNDQLIYSEYFALTMNTLRLQHRLKTVGLGATIPAIPKNELLQTSINVPSKMHQQKLMWIDRNLAQQIQLQRNILEQKIKLKHGLLNKLTSNELLIK